MATGRSIQLTKQVGEYLVAAELGRRGLIASTFSGSVPDYDIIATDSSFRSVPVQVKASNGSSWQFDIRRFADVQLVGKKQVIGRRTKLPREIIFVMVVLVKDGSDRFYVLSLKSLQRLLVDHHRAYLAKHGGVRPRKYDSFHAAITEADLLAFKDGWLAAFHDTAGLLITDPGR